MAGLKYTFNTTNAAPPPDRAIRLSDAQALAIDIYIDANVTDGTDVSAQLLALKAGDKLHIVQDTDTTRFVHYNVMSAAINRSGYVQVAVSSYSSGGSLAGSAPVTLTIEAAAVTPPTSVYSVQEYKNATLKLNHGWAKTEEAANIFAAAYFSAKMQLNPETGFVVVVVDSAGVIQSCLGWNATLPA